MQLEQRDVCVMVGSLDSRWNDCGFDYWPVAIPLHVAFTHSLHLRLAC